MGGTPGFGPIKAEPELEEPLFHAGWESRVMAITLASGMLGQWTLDRMRHARERQPTEQYLANSYYETWTEGLETLLLETGLVTKEELASGKAQGPGELSAADIARAKHILATGGPTLMDDGPEPVFKVGDTVKVRIIEGPDYTRAPAYTQGHVGAIEMYHGIHVFADTSAKAPEDGGGRIGEPLYSVRFSARELWGETAGEKDCVRVDLWQPYLERV